MAVADKARNAAVKALLAEAQQNPRILAEVCAAISELPPAGAAWIAICIGAEVESGIDAAHSFPALWALFVSWLDALDIESDVASQEGAADQSSRARDDLALQYLGQSIVSHLAALPEQRANLRADAAVMARLDAREHLNYGVSWVLEALRRRNGSVLVLHPIERFGFRVRFQNVYNCFHLFSLLQSALADAIPGGKAPAQSLVDALEGRAKSAVQDRAHWHYGDPRSNVPDIMRSIWGEGSVDEIPAIRGEQVILLWPPILAGRSWSTGFFTPYLMQLPAKAAVEARLSKEDVIGWLEILRIDAVPLVVPEEKSGQPKRPWWKFW